MLIQIFKNLYDWVRSKKSFALGLVGSLENIVLKFRTLRVKIESFLLKPGAFYVFVLKVSAVGEGGGWLWACDARAFFLQSFS